MTTRRERVRQATIEEIKSTAWEIINNQGTSDVTIHGITRKMGMTAPAFYSYFKSRDELIESLILDAYESYQQALETARDNFQVTEAANRIMAIYLAYRDWAINHPALFGLFVGKEVPGFKPPEGQIALKADTIIRLFLSVYQDSWQRGLLELPDEPLPLPEAYEAQVSRINEKLGLSMPAEIMNSVFHIAFLAHGIISMEISSRFSYLAGNFTQLYTYQISNELKRIGLNPDLAEPTI
jgi:AcrR family transcriptional regulator